MGKRAPEPEWGVEVDRSQDVKMVPIGEAEEGADAPPPGHGPGALEASRHPGAEEADAEEQRLVGELQDSERVLYLLTGEDITELADRCDMELEFDLAQAIKDKATRVIQKKVTTVMDVMKGEQDEG
tara:strand:+ start:6010 stop:6390 length:381 start_codon:yes stop_codon:yes gene_type:complete